MMTDDMAAVITAPPGVAGREAFSRRFAEEIEAALEGVDWLVVASFELFFLLAYGSPGGVADDDRLAGALRCSAEVWRWRRGAMLRARLVQRVTLAGGATVMTFGAALPYQRADHLRWLDCHRRGSPGEYCWDVAGVRRL